MKRLSRLLYIVGVLLASGVLSRALTIPASEDTTSIQKQITAKTNSDVLLTVDATRTGFVYFNLDDIPKGTAIRLARLRVYLPSMTAKGNGISVHLVTGQWAETTTGTEPKYDATPFVKMDAANLGSRRFVTVDVTAVVQNWINLSVVNEGFALVSVPTGDAKTPSATVTIAAKEGISTGLPAHLEIELADETKVGPAGPAGAQGLRGLQGVAGPQGPKGDTGAKGPTGLTGPAGAPGAAGVSGKTILSGAGAPGIETGGMGDFYLNTATTSLYGPKTSGGWGTPKSLVGPAGPKGAAGQMVSIGTGAITADKLSADAVQRIVDAAVKAAVEAIKPLIPATVSTPEGMVTVQGGTLQDGSELQGQVVGDFLIGKYEVTWGEWKTVREWALAHGYTDLLNVGEGVANNYPVTNVSWLDAVKWCNARSEKEGKAPVYKVSGLTYQIGESTPTVNSSANGYRLPTEAEWEWAARGGAETKGYTYSGSNDVNVVAWTSLNSSDSVKGAGTLATNELGIYDMSGNVWEWCWDLSPNNYDRRNRGGSWGWGAAVASVSYREGFNSPDVRGAGIGFRIACSSGQ